METEFKQSGYKPFFNPILLCFFLMIIVSACKSQRNVVKSQDGKLSVDKEIIIRDLGSIIDPGSELTVQEKKALLKAIKGHRFQDAQVDSLIIVAENLLNPVQVPQQEVNNEPVEVVVKEETDPKVELESILTDRFNDLINPEMADNSDDIIIETLDYFESGDSPVLIVLQRLNGKLYYDRPTTIKRYLYYLKDLKKNSHEIEEMDLNNDDKINKLILASK